MPDPSSEVVCLAPVLDQGSLPRPTHGVSTKASTIQDCLTFYQVEGLAQMIQGANPGHLHADDLCQDSTTSRHTFERNPSAVATAIVYHLTLAASYVLDCNG
jgi:hypothetical protein